MVDRKRLSLYDKPNNRSVMCGISANVSNSKCNKPEALYDGGDWVVRAKLHWSIWVDTKLFRHKAVHAVDKDSWFHISLSRLIQGCLVESLGRQSWVLRAWRFACVSPMCTRLAEATSEGKLGGPGV